MIDLIGDIHGYADQLKAILFKLGYEKKGKIYTHSERKVLFLGDYINKGPKIKETLETVRAMADHGSAIALMGNHEFNALCDLNKFQDESFSNDRSLISGETLLAFNNNFEEFKNYVEWFKTLPLFYEDNYFRAVHACWDKDNIAFLKKMLSNGKLTDELIIKIIQGDPLLNNAIKETLTGIDLELPGTFFFEEQGTSTKIRIKWWEDPSNLTYQGLSVDKSENLPDAPVDLSRLKSRAFYKKDEKPVFFGHYGSAGFSSLIRHNVCCLDFGVANEGCLAAYRMDDAASLSNRKVLIA